jgi:hypothetical protein
MSLKTEADDLLKLALEVRSESLRMASGASALVDAFDRNAHQCERVRAGAGRIPLRTKVER